MSDRPLIGVSSCLLGESVRFDGGHKCDRWMVRKLSRFVRWHSICPEVTMGFGVPRESLRLIRLEKKGSIHLVGNSTQNDFTEHAQQMCKMMVEALPDRLCGYILKNRSPSCGLERVKVYDYRGSPFSDGVGFFAQALINRFPDLPVIEEGRLSNLAEREHFLIRVFAEFALQNTLPKISAIQKLHESYKFILQAHHEASLRKLGQIAANSERFSPREVYMNYKTIFSRALAHPPTSKKRINAIQHIFGFIKDELTLKEKRSLLRQIEEFRKGRIPYVALSVLIRHAIEHHGAPYIEKQRFFSPYPEDLELT